MELGHDTDLCLRLAIDLVNSDRVAKGIDELQSPAVLRRFLGDHRVSSLGRVTQTDLKLIRGLRAELRRVFNCDDASKAAQILNALLAEAGARPFLSDHDDEPWHLHFTPRDAPLVHRVGADGAMALATVIANEGLDRLRVCEAEDCKDVFVDMSKNRSRRYCDPVLCGNRMHVAAYRARRRAGLRGVAG